MSPPIPCTPVGVGGHSLILSQVTFRLSGQILAVIATKLVAQTARMIYRSSVGLELIGA